MFSAAYQALMATDPQEKIALVQAIAIPAVPPMAEALPIQTVNPPGRPARPELVLPAKVPKRSNLRLTENRAAMLHAFAHIEFNAINLALDAIYRFREMPLQYYHDWLQVAREEGYHFNLLCAHLADLGYQYGDFAAHNSLWEMAVKTDADVMARMALVPRILEARGLDAVPPLQAKLGAVGDQRACEILDIILRDEIGHVRIGNRWFHWCCDQRGLEPIATFVRLVREYDAPQFRGAMNHLARVEAGFSQEEIELIETLRT